jgi:uncharacterized protein with PQ loop repeat
VKILVDIAFVAAIILPMWNIPLIAKVIKRRSSADISLWWAIGVWTCLLFMFPSGILSPDPVYKIFTIANFSLFSITAFIILIYHRSS